MLHTKDAYDFMQSKINETKKDTLYTEKEMVVIGVIIAIISGVIGLIVGGIN